ncbi:peptidylprolyl isomerase [Rubinisphaera margarita]|uniref:peptidylprolyl isomerase n=1 Tax=Rubinisphaera margarita TaxID=2909586 RepID=UPI001EE87941|nr:peptidylprolyl isomerase [Rubinisphaera margarita]MCG6155469.1 peptidylprolyl isomerase [Rubinisphaera margarita]
MPVPFPTHLWIAAFCLTVCLLGPPVEAQAAFQPKVVAMVNGQSITDTDVRQALAMRGILKEGSADTYSTMLDRLVERSLIRQFLRSRGVTAPQSQLESQMKVVDRVLAQEGSADDALAKLQITRKDLEEELELSLAWQRYVRQAVTDEQIRNYFNENRTRLDGTRVTASQIFLELSKEASSADAEQKLQQLTDLRKKIASGELTFSEAARQHSESPSADNGGKLGTFAYTGQMPREIATAAFDTDAGSMGEPFRSKYGVHLLHIDEVIPGQLSLEDARPQIFRHFEDKLWRETVEKLNSGGTVRILGR